MEFIVKTGHPEKQPSNCIVVGIFEPRRLSEAAKHLDTLSKGYLNQVLAQGDLEGKSDHHLLLPQVPNIEAKRIQLIGCGKEEELTDRAFLSIIRKSIQALLKSGTTEATLCLLELPIKNRDIQWKIKQSIQIIDDLLYSFDQFKTKKDSHKKVLQKITFMVPTEAEVSLGARAVQEGQAIAHGINFTKDLANLPPNICTPSYLGKTAEDLAKKFPAITATILDEKAITELKMGALLSVGQSSKHPPRFIILEYRGSQDKQKPLVFVGKGITFDTGGNSIKTAAGMIGMKYDMCGGATVFGLLRAVAELALPLHIIGIIPAAENMPGNEASRPEDIVTSMSGTTIEILNTDAEGRLILCDALTYCERFEPELVIDIATLTGSCILALGAHTSGLLSNDENLAKDLFNAGIMSYDRCWQFPLWEEYQEALNSNFADIANIGNPPEAGVILGGCFLSRFTKKYPWAHLDVAGTATRSGKERGATGRPLPLLMQYILDRLK